MKKQKPLKSPAGIFVYNAKVTRVYDGDTIIVDIDCGFGFIYTEQKIRMARINAPELRGVQKPEGEKSKEFLKTLIEGKAIILNTVKDDKEKFGRYLGEVFFEGQNVNDLMVKKGLAEYKEY